MLIGHPTIKKMAVIEVTGNKIVINKVILSLRDAKVPWF